MSPKHKLLLHFPSKLQPHSQLILISTNTPSLNLMQLIMNSNSNTTQWPPYPTYINCSQNQCSIYCPQWCYIFPPPQQFDTANDDDHSSSLANDFSPLIIAVIGVMASAFIIITYITFISKRCNNRDDMNQTSFNSLQTSSFSLSSGLDEAVIRSIGVCEYKKGDGFVDETECSVCLNEFENDEKLRLLPKCNHAFHILCIDTWFKSHVTCPLCRCTVVDLRVPVSETVNTEMETIVVIPRHHVRNDTVVVEVEDLEAIVAEGQQEHGNNNQCMVRIRRSASMDSSTSSQVDDN